MSPNVQLAVETGRVRALAVALQTLQGAVSDAWIAAEWEDGVRECLMLPDALRQLWRSLFNRLKLMPSPEILEVRQPLMELFAVARQALEGLRGQVPTRATDVQSALVELQRVEQAIFEHWPRFDAADLEAARAESERGECVPVEDLLHELQGRITSAARV